MLDRSNRWGDGFCNRKRFGSAVLMLDNCDAACPAVHGDLLPCPVYLRESRRCDCKRKADRRLYVHRLLHALAVDAEISIRQTENLERFVIKANQALIFHPRWSALVEHRLIMPLQGAMF